MRIDGGRAVGWGAAIDRAGVGRAARGRSGAARSDLDAGDAAGKGERKIGGSSHAEVSAGACDSRDMPPAVRGWPRRAGSRVSVRTASVPLRTSRATGGSRAYETRTATLS